MKINPKPFHKTYKPYTSPSVLEIDAAFHSLPKKVILTGSSLTLREIIAVARNNAQVEFTNDPEVLNRIKLSHKKMIEQVQEGIPIYGCNTGYGARASRVVTNGTPEKRIEMAREVSEGIAHIDVSVGPVFEKEVTRAAILIRLNMLMHGVSAVKIEDLEIYRQMLNNDIIPIVNQYGGIGASGDLAHNCRVLSAARQLKGTLVWDQNGEIKEANVALKKAGIPALNLDPKAGLGLVNGDNFSTALAGLLAYDTLQCLIISTVLGSLVIEVLKGTDRSFHPLLAEVRPHEGQKEVASLYRFLLKGSKLAYQEMTGHKIRPKGIKVQDSYSLRCISQYHGVNFDKIKQILRIIEINANSVSDNPLWVPQEYTTENEAPWQWVSGGNFIAMHMVEAIDGLRKIMTQMVKLNDRHLAKMVNPHENNELPANLSDKLAITHCSFKGVQIQSGMFDVYSSLLSIPVSTFFGVHEEGNQDITSHALTSGIFGIENLRLVHYSIAQTLVAVAQAVDLRGGAMNLSPHTRPFYDLIRAKTAFVEKERPLHNDIEEVYKSLKNGEVIQLARSKVFKGYESSKYFK